MKKAARRAAREARPWAAPQPTQENRDSCDMRERPEDFDFHGPDARPGDFAFVSITAPNGQPYVAMWHILPDGSVGALPLEPIPQAAHATWTHGDPPTLHTWRWDGNRERPSLTPSVWRRGHWHGWFRAGRMVSC